MSLDTEFRPLFNTLYRGKRSVNSDQWQIRSVHIMGPHFTKSISDGAYNETDP